MTKVWTRTCQECGHKQKDKEPDHNKELTVAYTERKCKKCGSIGLDYGTYPTDVEQDFTDGHMNDVRFGEPNDY